MSAAPRILIISSGNPSRNPRPLKEAQLLAASGYAVTFLCPQGDPGLHEEDRYLAEQGGFLLQRAGSPHTFFQRFARWLAVRAVRLGFQHKRSLGDVRPLLNKARACAADLTIVHNELPHLLGLRLLQEGHRVAADFEDWYSEDLLPADRVGRPLRLLRRNEAALLRRASLCTTTSEALAAALSSAYQAPVPLVIANAFPLQPRPLVRTATTPPSLFWFSQTIGPGRGIEPLLDAWILSRAPSSLVLLGTPCRNYPEHLQDRLPAEFRRRLSILPTVSNEALPALIACHDIGLALEDAGIRNRDLTITNKILQYLNAGLAVFATHTRGQHEVLDKNPGAGVFLDLQSPARAATVMDSVLSDPDAIARTGRNARLLAEEHYCWEKQAPKLLLGIKLALARPPT